MAKTALRYVLVGSGKWSQVISRALSGLGRQVTTIGNARKMADESDSSYLNRMHGAFSFSGGTVAWLCLAPGHHIVLLAEAALRAGLHLIAEKPWMAEKLETARLIGVAASTGKLIGVHFEYCYLDQIAAWRRTFRNKEGLVFDGCFNISAKGKYGIAAEHNLGSHLIAIREYSVPQATIGTIVCNYGAKDCREVALRRHGGGVVSRIDFHRNNEPIVQRYVVDFEDAIATGREFPLDVAFAQRVRDVIGECLASG